MEDLDDAPSERFTWWRGIALVMLAFGMAVCFGISLFTSVALDIVQARERAAVVTMVSQQQQQQRDKNPCPYICGDAWTGVYCCS